MSNTINLPCQAAGCKCVPIASKGLPVSIKLAIDNTMKDGTSFVVLPVFEIDKIKSLFMYSMFICDVPSVIIMKSIKIIDSISLSNEYRLRQAGKMLELDPEIIFIRNIGKKMFHDF